MTSKRVSIARKFALNITRLAVFGNGALIFIFMGVLVTCGTTQPLLTFLTGIIAVGSTVFCIWKLRKLKPSADREVESLSLVRQE